MHAVCAIAPGKTLRSRPQLMLMDLIGEECQDGKGEAAYCWNGYTNGIFKSFPDVKGNLRENIQPHKYIQCFFSFHSLIHSITKYICVSTLYQVLLEDENTMVDIQELPLLTESTWMNRLSCLQEVPRS